MSHGALIVTGIPTSEIRATATPLTGPPPGPADDFWEEIVEVSVHTRAACGSNPLSRARSTTCTPQPSGTGLVPAPRSRARPQRPPGQDQHRTSGEMPRDDLARAVGRRRHPAHERPPGTQPRSHGWRVPAATARFRTEQGAGDAPPSPSPGVAHLRVSGPQAPPGSENVSTTTTAASTGDNRDTSAGRRSPHITRPTPRSQVRIPSHSAPHGLPLLQAGRFQVGMRQTAPA